MNFKTKKLLACLFPFFLLQVILGISLNKQLLKNNINEEEHCKQVKATFHKKVETAFYNNDSSSSYTRLLSNFFKQTILPNLKSRTSFLDIGAGPGEVTNQIAPHFDSTTIVDPDPTHKGKYTAQNLTVHTSLFQDIQLPHKNYDFVLCSHVLYFIEHQEWAAFLKKLHSHINKNGHGLVVLVAPRGKWHELRKSIKSNYSHSALVEENLNKLNIKYRKTPSCDYFSTTNYNEFRQIVYLFTIADCFTSQKDFEILAEDERNSIFAKIDTFIENCKTEDNRYEVMCEDDYLDFSA